MSEIFKSYDVRGLYPEEINEELVERIGRAYVAYTKAKCVPTFCFLLFIKKNIGKI